MVSAVRARPALWRQGRLLVSSQGPQFRTGLQWARHASHSGRPMRSGGRVIKLLGVFAISAVAFGTYPLIFNKQSTPAPDAAKPVHAEIVFEKERPRAASPEDGRDLLSSQHLQVKKSWELPGVYAWGSNSGQVVAPGSKETYVKTPRRIPYFDGKILRDLKLERGHGAAITEAGDLVQWGNSFSKTSTGPTVTARRRDLVKLALSQDRILALSSTGAVYSFPVSKDDSPAVEGSQTSNSSWFPLWSSSSTDSGIMRMEPSTLGWGEKVVDISSGREHCLMLTSKGRVFSAASSAEGFPSQGQLGIPGLTWNTRPAGPYWQPHEVLGLSAAKAVQIATGDFHSVVLDGAGRLFAFGSNVAGQLGVPSEAEARHVVDRPKLLALQNLYSGTPTAPKVTSVAAGGLNSYFTVSRTAAAGSRPSGETADTWACGEGIYGSLGNGKWTHGQPSTSPAKVKSLSGLYEYDEGNNKTVPISLASISVGNTHASATMNNITNVSASGKSGNDTNWGADVLFWGRNESYQLGTGKRNNENLPIYIGPLDGGKGDAEKGRKGEVHRFQITPRQTVRLGPKGDGRKVSVEQRVECGRDVSAIYSGV